MVLHSRLSPADPPAFFRLPFLQVVDAINALSVGKPENTAGAEEDVLIVDAGQIRPGTIVPDLNRER